MIGSHRHFRDCGIFRGPQTAAQTQTNDPGGKKTVVLVFNRHQRLNR